MSIVVSGQIGEEQYEVVVHADHIEGPANIVNWLMDLMPEGVNMAEHVLTMAGDLRRLWGDTLLMTEKVG